MPEAAGAPAPDIRIPSGPGRLAAALKETSAELDEAIDGWTESGQVRQPERVVLLALHLLRAEKRFGVEWEVLGAIMLVETKFGRVRSASSSGAQGPMQFMPGTWRLYGMGGNVHDARDAILAAANYLKATGAPRDYRRAVFAYNHDTRYVDAVLAHARQIKRDPRTFYAYYNWQVFVLSAKGDVRLTGPR